MTTPADSELWLGHFRRPAEADRSRRLDARQLCCAGAADRRLRQKQGFDRGSGMARPDRFRGTGYVRRLTAV